MKVPALDQINSLSLEELNKEILRISAQLNKNLKILRKNSTKKSIEYAINYLEKKSGLATPDLADPLGMLNKFSTRKAKTIQEARSRLSVLVKTASSQKSNLKKIKQTDKKRKSSFEDKIDIKLSNEEYDTLINLLHHVNVNSLDSEQIISAFEEKSITKFRNAQDFEEFVKEKVESGRLGLELSKLNESSEEKGKYYKINGEWKQSPNY